MCFTLIATKAALRGGDSGQLFFHSPSFIWCLQAQQMGFPSTHTVLCGNLCWYPLLLYFLECLKCVWKKILVKFLRFTLVGHRDEIAGFACRFVLRPSACYPAVGCWRAPSASPWCCFHFLSDSKSKIWYCAGLRTPCIFGTQKGQSGRWFWPSFFPIFLYLTPNKAMIFKTTGPELRSCIENSSLRSHLFLSFLLALCMSRN